MASAAQAHTLTSYYIKKYEERYDEKPVVNRNSARWSWDNMLQDFTPVEIKEILDYYFDSNSAKAHDLTNFFYNYDKIILSKKAQEKDRAERKRMMKETEERTKAYLAKREALAKKVKDNN